MALSILSVLTQEHRSSVFHQDHHGAHSALYVFCILRWTKRGPFAFARLPIFCRTIPMLALTPRSAPMPKSESNILNYVILLRQQSCSIADGFQQIRSN